MNCSTCGWPVKDHCQVHLIPCCPGKCVGPRVPSGGGEGQHEQDLGDGRAVDVDAAWKVLADRLAHYSSQACLNVDPDCFRCQAVIALDQLRNHYFPPHASTTPPEVAPSSEEWTPEAALAFIKARPGDNDADAIITSLANRLLAPATTKAERSEHPYETAVRKTRELLGGEQSSPSAEAGSARLIIRAGDRLAGAVEHLIRLGRVDARNEAGDALLDYDNLNDHRAVLGVTPRSAAATDDLGSSPAPAPSGSLPDTATQPNDDLGGKQGLPSVEVGARNTKPQEPFPSTPEARSTHDGKTGQSPVAPKYKCQCGRTSPGGCEVRACWWKADYRRGTTTR